MPLKATCFRISCSNAEFRPGSMEHSYREAWESCRLRASFGSSSTMRITNQREPLLTIGNRPLSQIPFPRRQLVGPKALLPQ